MSDEPRDPDLGEDLVCSKYEAPSGWDYLSDGGRIMCAFSTARAARMGVGVNMRKHESLAYWFVEQVDDDLFEARRINARHVPAGDSEPVSLSRLISEFTPQIAYYEEKVLPAIEELKGILDRGDEFREDGRLYSAEMEYEHARGIEEKNVRALFGLGLIYLSRREVRRTRNLLAELVQIKAVFSGKNQHLFNEFGIALRKSSLFSEAVVYYQRALDFVTDDENLYYNLSRSYYEDGDWNGCLEALIISHRINPGLEIVRDLFEVIVGLAENERLLERYGKPPVPRKVLARARQILAVETGRSSLDEAPVVIGPARGRARTGLESKPDSGLEDTDDSYDR